MTSDPMTDDRACESCGMPIDTGTWCAHCVDDQGRLQSFAERFATMVAWQQNRNPGLNADDARSQTLTYMSTMPAWRSHPDLIAALAHGEDAAGVRSLDDLEGRQGSSGSW